MACESAVKFEKRTCGAYCSGRLSTTQAGKSQVPPAARQTRVGTEIVAPQVRVSALLPPPFGDGCCCKHTVPGAEMLLPPRCFFYDDHADARCRDRRCRREMVRPFADSGARRYSADHGAGDLLVARGPGESDGHRRQGFGEGLGTRDDRGGCGPHPAETEAGATRSLIASRTRAEGCRRGPLAMPDMRAAMPRPPSMPDDGEPEIAHVTLLFRWRAHCCQLRSPWSRAAAD